MSQSNTENLPANDDESCAGDNTDMSSESSESDTLTGGETNHYDHLIYLDIIFLSKITAFLKLWCV